MFDRAWLLKLVAINLKSKTHEEANSWNFWDMLKGQDSHFLGYENPKTFPNLKVPNSCVHNQRSFCIEFMLFSVNGRTNRESFAPVYTRY